MEYFIEIFYFAHIFLKEYKYFISKFQIIFDRKKGSEIILCLKRA